MSNHTTDNICSCGPYSIPRSNAGMKGSWKAYIGLCKLRVSLFAALSALTGSILAAAEITHAVLGTVTGTFILACGAGALNQYQERHVDACLKRTACRPIPAGIIIESHALYLSVSLAIAGSLIILASGGWMSAGLGLFAILWYNLIYTNLKRVTAFAAVPGAIVGAIPPAMGWVAGGGSLYDSALFILCFFFFIWQVPHFWLILFSHAGEYERADLPSLVRIFKRAQFNRIVVTWITTSAVTLLMIPVFGVPVSSVSYIMLCVLSVWLLGTGYGVLMKKDRSGAYTLLFKSINAFMLCVMILLNADKLLT